MKISIPYGKSTLSCEVPDARLKGVLTSKAHAFKAEASEAELVRHSLASPIDSRPLRELAKGKKRVVVITSDHTRPVPSAITMPLLLEEIRAGNPEAQIAILIATGSHRETTRDEVAARFGAEIASKETIVVHDCRDESSLVSAGTLPSGGELVLNRLVVDCDLLVAEGFIEPHFFAGYSGGRKAVLPGVAGYATVLANHCAEFIADDRSRTGVLDGNPIHKDMMYAVRAVGLAFILNVVIDADKKIIAAFAGDADTAHRKGCDFVSELAGVKAAPADIVITGNGGYPLDQNIYQTVKCMTAAEASIRPGGIIVAAAEAVDGHGGEGFYETFKDARLPDGTVDPESAMRAIMARGRGETRPDQWQSQILIRILLKHKVVVVTSAPREMVEHLGMIHASSMEEALATADRLTGNKNASVTVIPDGVSVIVRD